jgi:hypothetical protein
VSGRVPQLEGQIVKAGRDAGIAFLSAHPEPTLQQINTAVASAFMIWSEANPKPHRDALAHMSVPNVFRSAFWDACSNPAAPAGPAKRRRQR